MAFRLRLTSPRGARGLKRQYKTARDAGLRAAGEYWTEKILPGHFQAGAESKYRYKARTKAHLRRKRREGRGENPNVYTGKLAQKMQGTRPSFTINKGGAVLVWRGLPRYTYVVDTVEWVANDWRWNDLAVSKLSEKAQMGVMKWRDNHPETKNGRFKSVPRPNKPAELTAMNREDASAVAKVFRQVFQEGLK